MRLKLFSDHGFAHGGRFLKCLCIEISRKSIALELHFMLPDMVHPTTFKLTFKNTSSALGSPRRFGVKYAIFINYESLNKPVG